MSNPGIFLIQDNDELVEMNEEPYKSEDLLQTLLAKYPALLAGNQMSPSAPIKWLFIERESAVPAEEGGGGRWAADHLFLDQDAVPTLVEVKRSTNTDIRRKVVGQMLDYAANAVVYWPAAHMRERFTVDCKAGGFDPEERLEEFLEGRMEAEDFWRLADKNLQDRKIRLLFVADEIPTELQRIVEFLNEQMDRTEVLAIEIKQFIGKGQTGLVPRLIGQTAEAQNKKSPGPRPPTNEDEFFRLLAENTSPEDVDVARRILNWSKQNASYVKWRSISFAPVFECGSDYPHMPTSVSVYGGVGINFARMQKSHGLPDERREELLRRLNDIRGINLPDESIQKKPSIPLLILKDDEVLERFLSVMAWTVEAVKAAHQTAPTSIQSRSAQLV